VASTLGTVRCALGIARDDPDRRRADAGDDHGHQVGTAAVLGTVSLVDAIVEIYADGLERDLFRETRGKDAPCLLAYDFNRVIAPVEQTDDVVPFGFVFLGERTADARPVADVAGRFGVSPLYCDSAGCKLRSHLESHALTARVLRAILA
jgi:hypothetical protein